MVMERKRHSFIIRTANGELQLLTGEFVRIIRERFAREDIYASCLTCRNMDATNRYNPICKKFNATPPIDILVNSCSEYDDHDDIPL